MLSKDCADVLVFITSQRGRYLLAQALRLAIEELDSVGPDYMKEVSNIEDMKYMLHSDFLSHSNKMVALAEDYRRKNKQEIS